MFSAKALMTILDGIEQLAQVRAVPGNGITVTPIQTTIFERLESSFNNPTLLKEIGLLYLNEFRLPAVALKHFDLVYQYAPKDRDIEELQKAATLAMAKRATDQPGHSGIGEPVPDKPELSRLIRKTSLINVVETRSHLTETAGELERKQMAWRRTGKVKQDILKQPIDYTRELGQVQRLISQTDFAGAAAILAEGKKLGAPKEELQVSYAQLGLAAFDYSRMEEALQAFLQMRDLGPESVEGWFNCGLVYQKMGRIDEAIASYQQAAKLAPDNPKPWCNLSSVSFERGDFADAEKAAKKALELKPDYARAWDNLAATLSAINHLDEAELACQQAIRIQPTLYSAWFKLGVIHFQRDDLVPAMEAFSLTGDNPDLFAYVLYYMSMIEARRGELDQALQKLSQARSADPTNDLELSALREIGTAFSRFGKYGLAADFFDQITAKRPDDFSAWLSMGTAYHRAEQFDKAHAAYLQATKLKPDNSVPWHNLGLLASDQGNLEESCKCFQREVELAPEDAKAWYDLGVSLQTLGREDESATAFEQAEGLVKSLSRRSSDLSAALSIVRRLNLGDRVLKAE